MKDIITRMSLLIVGTLIMSAGIVFLTKSNLGTSPISSFPFVLSLSIPNLSYGTWIALWNVVIITAQIIILRRDFQLIALLQIPICLLFSVGVDVIDYFTVAFVPTNYIMQLGFVFLGLILQAFGVACTVVANIAMNPGESLVCAITSKTGWNFGYTKIGFDAACVIIAIATSFIMLQTLTGVREGTLIAAFATGLFSNLFIKMLGGVRPPIKKFEKSDNTDECEHCVQSREGSFVN